MNERGPIDERPAIDEPRPGMKLTRRGKIVLAFGILLTIVGVVALGGVIYLNSIGVMGGSDPGRVVKVEIPEGSGMDEIGDILEKAGVIKSAFGLRVADYLDGSDETVQAGTYELSKGLSAGDALDALRGGPKSEFVNVTFPEGSWLTDFAGRLEEDTHISGDAFLRLATNGSVRSKFQPEDVDTLEGLLFPSTYQVVEEDTARSVLERLVAEFDKRYSAMDRSPAEALGLTEYEIAIVASMIEAEAQIDEERPMIARVIYNRLAANDLLGIDATVNYAIGEHKLDLTVSELDVDSPYNTRRYPGLPPTPIGAPGEASLQAALAPSDGDWYYYVLSDCEGHHAFSSSAEEFAADRAAYQSLEC